MLNQIETFTQLTYGQLIGMTFLVGSLLIFINILNNIFSIMRLNITLKPSTKTIYICIIVISVILAVAGLYLVITY